MEDETSLDRFISAQYGQYQEVVTELRSGRKRSHWMWYIFPQLRGLGESWNSHFYGVAGLDEARAYLAHPVLGPRLLECTALVNAAGRSATAIFGEVDAMKLRSSMTLFILASDGAAPFTECLARHYGGERDQETLKRLRSPG